MNKAILVLFLTCIPQIFSSVSAQSMQNRYFDHIFSCKFEQADSLLQSFEAYLLPEEKNLLQAFAALHKSEAQKNNSDKYKAEYLNLAKKVFEILRGKKLNDRQLFYYTASLGIIIKSKMNNKHYFSVIKDLYNLSSKIEYIIDNEGKNEYFQLVSGMYHYYAALATEDYPIMRGVFLVLPKGDKTHGLQMLETCSSESNRFVSVYALYYLARINHRDEKVFSESNFYFRQLLAEFPENCFWRSEYIKMLNYFGYKAAAYAQEKILKVYLCK